MWRQPPSAVVRPQVEAFPVRPVNPARKRRPAGSGSVWPFYNFCHPERSRFSGVAKDLPRKRPNAREPNCTTTVPAYQRDFLSISSSNRRSRFIQPSFSARSDF